MHTLQSVALTPEKRLQTLIENRTVFTLNNCELNVFQTQQSAALVPLRFPDFVVTSMLQGKKVMHLPQKPSFEYLPGETVLVGANEKMEIDFPEAQINNPTQCIALAIDQVHINHTLNFLNEKYPRLNGTEAWQLHRNNYHFKNNLELSQTINKLISVCSSSGMSKDVLADLALQELVVHIIQTQHLVGITDGTFGSWQKETPLSSVVEYIRANIDQKLQIDQLSYKACMSKATFYRAFKREFGISPLEFILLERIKMAKRLLHDPAANISSVCYELGFTDLNYFIRLFKKTEGITPKQYRQQSLSIA